MRADIVLVGGGLANALIALELLERQPQLDVRVVEREESAGGQHVWSFHPSDLSARQRRRIEPLVAHSWPTHEVRFPELRRELEGGYCSLTSDRLDRVLRECLRERLLLGREVVEVEADHVALAGGERLEARAVIDGRGAVPTTAFEVAYQKFVGLHVELDAPCGLEGPILMDATVPQVDGYRFIYTLPFDERSLLIEDTRYSDGADLDSEGMRTAILDYAESRGWSVSGVVEEEQGVLPIVLSGDIDAFWREAPAGVPRSGMRAALFQPTTGYSLPDAMALADELGAIDSPSSAELDRVVRRRSRRAWRRSGFFRLLNRMLFHAAEPAERYRVLQRFYGLPEPLIRRFYAGRPTIGDRIRILTGKPPVPIHRALACLLPRASRQPANPSA
jgi:lycopene beta-cyclase